jgi:DNA-binding transcriptional LysR family regulator
LAGLATFLTVAEKRSFRAAGDELRVTASAVSQTVKQLEEQLGLQLLRRTTRSVSLTEAGEYLYRGLTPAFGEMRATLESLNELKSRPAGTLRLSVSSIAESFLTETTLSGFLARYPEVKLDVCVDDGPADIVQQGFDAGVRLGEVIAQDMVAVSVSAPQRQIVVGSPEYLSRHPAPAHPRDLHGHVCIGWRHYGNAAPYRWEFTEEGRDFEVVVEARVNTNDMGLMLRLARQGVGLTVGMEETFRPYVARGELLPVLEAFCPEFAGFFLYYPSRVHTPPKLRALVDYMRTRRAQERQAT